MDSFREIIDAIGDYRDLGAAIGVSPNRASVMRTRGRVAPKYWPNLVEHARRRGIEGVDYEALCRLYDQRPGDASPGDGASQ